MTDIEVRSETASEQPPFLHLDRPPAEVEVVAGANGEIELSCPRTMPAHPDSLLDYLTEAARDHGDRIFLAERENGATGPWIEMTYSQCLARSEAVGQWLLDRGYGPERPVMILSENSLAHAVITLGAMSISSPVAPVSPAYSLLSRDFAKLRYIFDLIEPGLIFVEEVERFARALDALDLTGIDVVAVKDGTDGVIAFDSLLETRPTKSVAEARSRITPDTVGKILFTSGSTGIPKGVINTHRMFCAVQGMLEDIRDISREDEPGVVLDWLPWHHTFGGNATMNSILRGAATLYIDAGRPVPGLFDITIQNLREIAPTYFSCVPGTYAALADALEADDALRRNFFSRLQGMSYGGAALPQALYERMQSLSIRELGHRLNLSTGYGATETGALNTAVYWETERMGLIGLPLPGVRLKLLTVGGKFEVRVKGPQIMPGYHKRPDLDAEAFDENGWFKTGDAAVWADPDDPLQGLVFAGRVSEDFKLTSGTWVHTGTLRVDALAALSPLASDALVAGHNRSEVGLLVWPNMAALKTIAPDVNPSQLLDDDRIRDKFGEALAGYNATVTGSSRRLARLILMAEPPNIDAGEITDKRYINQRVSLERRSDLVEKLYAEPTDDSVVLG